MLGPGAWAPPGRARVIMALRKKYLESCRVMRVKPVGAFAEALVRCDARAAGVDTGDEVEAAADGGVACNLSGINLVSANKRTLSNAFVGAVSRGPWADREAALPATRDRPKIPAAVLGRLRGRRCVTLELSTAYQSHSDLHRTIPPFRWTQTACACGSASGTTRT